MGFLYPWFVPVYPTAIACGFGEFITLVGPFSPYSHCFGVCFAQEETCVMRPWHHQAANSRVFFNAHKCKVPSFMLVKTIRMSFRAYDEAKSLFVIFHSGCLLLYSLLSYHSLFDFIVPPFVPIIGPSTLQSDIISLIPIPLFLFLYPAPSFVLLSLCDPYSCRTSLFVLDGL